MLRIRLQRTGKKNQPFFRLVLTEKTSPPKSKALEVLGYYNPRKKDRSFKKDRILFWISKGAKVSDTAFNLLHDENIVEGQKIIKKKLSKKKREELAKKEQEEKEAQKNSQQEQKEQEQKDENAQEQEEAKQSEEDKAKEE